MVDPGWDSRLTPSGCFPRSIRCSDEAPCDDGLRCLPTGRCGQCATDQDCSSTEVCRSDGFCIDNDCPPALPRFRAIDQYGEEVDLYDFAGQGRNIAIEVGTRFCTPCKALAAFYTSGDSSTLEADFRWWRPEYADVRRQIEEGEIYWITVLFSGGNDPADAEDTAWWHEQWPNHNVAVLADTDLDLKNYLEVVSYPHVVVVDENLRVLMYHSSGPTHGFNYLVGR